MSARSLNPVETPFRRLVHRALYGAIVPVAGPLVHFLYGARVVTETDEPIPARSVVVLNHCCYLDSVMGAVALWPLRLRFLSEAGNGQGHPWAPIVRALGTIFVGSSLAEAKEMLRRQVEALDAGDTIAIYPEGNLDPYEGSLQDFKRGAFRIAAALRAPVVPITLVQTPHAGLKGLFGQSGFEVHVGAPIQAPTGLSRAKAARFLEERTRATMEAELSRGPVAGIAPHPVGVA